MEVGGPARYFVEAQNADEVREAVSYVRSSDLPLFVLGGGSNLVIADTGWPGLVLKIGIILSSKQGLAKIGIASSRRLSRTIAEESSV